VTNRLTSSGGVLSVAWRAPSDRLVLLSLLALAAILRFAWLPDRGAWDSDQGRDLLVLRSLLVEGALPLVGPVTSVGGVHHGAAYFYLLAPVAALGRLDPTVIAWPFGLAGVAMVGLVWWLARSIGGWVAGFTAGLLAALSPTAIASSFTIWNANLVAPAAALAVAAAWHARASQRARWWALALGAVGLAIQLHLAAIVLAVPVLGLLAADLRGAPRARRLQLGRAVLGGGVIVLVLFLPLLVHELATGFAELRSAVGFIAGGSAGDRPDAVGRLIVTELRIASWPIVGLVVDAALPASVLALLVPAVAAWRWQASMGRERTATRWLVGTLAWSAVALVFVAPELAMVVRGLPNDQYHAFTDPIVPVLLGLGTAGLAAKGSTAPGLRGHAWVAVAGLLIAGLIVFEALRLPPLRDPGGGWAAARSAAERVLGQTGDRTLLVIGLPRFKPADGFVFPLRQLGAEVMDRTGAPGSAADTATVGGTPRPAGPGPSAAGALVVICDRVFEPSMGATCAGTAEQAVELDQPGFDRLVDRFDQSERISVSIYLAAGGR
jgi:4-amino-4-deoxy-L-arabinose transferase-like glycosyltransferase